MAIGIGLHCWYCEHGPCNERCHEESERKVTTKKIKRSEAVVVKAKNLITSDMTSNQALRLIIAEQRDEIRRLKKLLKEKT